MSFEFVVRVFSFGKDFKDGRVILVSVAPESAIDLFKKGAFLVNTARGKLHDRDVVAAALQSDAWWLRWKCLVSPATLGDQCRGMA